MLLLFFGGGGGAVERNHPEYQREGNTWSVVIRSTNKKSRFHIALFHFLVGRKLLLDIFPWSIFLVAAAGYEAGNQWRITWEVRGTQATMTGVVELELKRWRLWRHLGWWTTSGGIKVRSRRLVQAAPPLRAPGVVSLQPQYFHLTGETPS